MKLLAVTVFALAAFGAVKASDPSLWQTWHAGAARVDAPVTEYTVDGEKLRNDTITAFDTYINTLEVDVERQYAWGVNDILQPCGLRFREIVGLQADVQAGTATPDHFDYQLWYLAVSYDHVVELARFGQEARQVHFQSEAFSETFRKRAEGLAVGTPRYTLNQLFYDFEHSVVERDFGKLREWLLETFDAGYQAVLAEAALMEENLRQKYLWTTVASLQRDSQTVSKYDESLEQYSTSIYWENYVRARADLWDL